MNSIAPSHRDDIVTELLPALPAYLGDRVRRLPFTITAAPASRSLGGADEH
ncbi:hypothetical protein ACIBJI_34735 [Nocardia sp. NPDC050408]|uniref:hypothetical protein n=1 Tax=Nocardia sp. NPDC050408 TaxID=3364319 RepID=UPI00379E4463